MQVADVMTRGVISVSPGDSMRRAAQLMLQYNLSGFPVVDHGNLVGMVTEGDFLRRFETGTNRINRDGMSSSRTQGGSLRDLRVLMGATSGK